MAEARTAPAPDRFSPGAAIPRAASHAAVRRRCRAVEVRCRGGVVPWRCRAMEVPCHGGALPWRTRSESSASLFRGVGHGFTAIAPTEQEVARRRDLIVQESNPRFGANEVSLEDLTPLGMSLRLLQ